MDPEVRRTYRATGLGEAVNEAGEVVRYAPEIFDCPDIAQSKRIILGPSPELTPEHRWEVETPWLMQHIKFDHDELVVDYGCGIGRLSREIKNPVLGVDISPMMRRHALDYVGGKPYFSVTSPEMFNIMVDAGLRISGLVAIWVFEHILEPAPVIRYLMGALRPNGVLWHIGINRSVPYRTTGQMDYLGANDGIPILPMLEQHCSLEEEIPVTAWPEYPHHDAGILRKYRRNGC